MDIVTQEKKQNKRYLPHELSTKINSVKLYRQTKDIDFVLRRYHISKASLMRWNKLYDGTKESLIPKSHKPHRQHPNAHTAEELRWIRNYHRRKWSFITADQFKRFLVINETVVFYWTGHSSYKNLNSQDLRLKPEVLTILGVQLAVHQRSGEEGDIVFAID